MDSALIALILATLGVSFGWQPTSDGPAGYEYTVQIEPEIADLLRRGETVPIESNVPPEVAPIRKVKIVVGRGEVKRRALATDATKLNKYVATDASKNRSRGASDAPNPDKLVVRGQSPDNAPWTPPQRSNQPASTPNVDRYGNRITTPGSGVAPPPGFAGRVGGAVDETAGVLRDGLEAGFAEANEQLSRAGDDLWQGTRGTTQNVAQQLQAVGGNLRDATQQTLGAVIGAQPPPFNESLANPTSAVQTRSAPPWPANQTAQTAARRAVVAGGPITRTPSGWTSIASHIAAPPVLPPALMSVDSNNAMVKNPGTRIASNDMSGPSFPGASANHRDSLHTALTDLAVDSRNNAQAATRDSRTASNAGNTVGDSGLVPIRPVNPQVPQREQASGGFADPWDDGRWELPPQASPVGNTAGNPAAPASNQGNHWANNASASGQAGWGNNANGPAVGFTGTSASRGQAAPSGDAQPTGQSPPLAATNSAPPATVPPTTAAVPTGMVAAAAVPTEVPWRPLLLVSLGLAGSLSANLFLGWSYLDARQRYVALVRKTAQSFRRRASDAAA